MTMNFGDPNPYPGFDQLKELGLPGANAKYFPYIPAMTTSRGGMKQMGALQQSLTRMLRTTANASLTWVKSNHTYKFGAEMRLEGLYTPGELGSFFGFLYPGGSNIPEAISFGRIAGENAAAEKAWS